MRTVIEPKRNTPTVSVVMPCFNALATIEESIASVQAQTHQDWELIVVDDGSLDGSPELVQDISSADRRIRLIRQQNSGPAVARNRGVRLARSNIIAFLDADDLWGKQHLELHCAKLAADPSLGISFSASRYIDESGALTGEGNRFPPQPLVFSDLLAGNPTGSCSALVVRRSVFEDAGEMRQDMVHAEDQEWLLRVLHSGWKIECLPEASIQYRISQNSLSSNIDKMLEGWNAVLSSARTYIPDIVEKERAPALAQMHLYFARRVVRSTRKQGEALQHLMKAIGTHPRISLESPMSILKTLTVCLLPDLTLGLRRRLVAHA